jgi:hypothetical protein
MLEQQNNQQVDALHSKVARLKEVRAKTQRERERLQTFSPLSLSLSGSPRGDDHL